MLIDRSHDPSFPSDHATGSVRGVRRVLIVSADIGAGHDVPARAVADDLAREDPSVQVTVLNGLPDMGRLLKALLRDGSWLALRHMPWVFELEYWLAARMLPTRWLGQFLLYRLSRRGVLRRIAAARPDAIVSTYPGLTAVLGELRRRGQIEVPVYSVITDLAGLHYWAHPGVDMHFVTHPESIEEVERITGRHNVRCARPPTSPQFFEPRDPAAARRALGLPAEKPVVAISGGGWGIGDLPGAVDTVLESQPDAVVVCLAGRDEQLHKRLERRYATEPRVRVMGFTNRIGDVMAAADALVHSTAGLTVLEAIMRGCPVVSYGFAVGHLRLNNAAFKRFGLARTANSPAALVVALRDALSDGGEPDLSFARRPAIASLVLNGELRATPLPTWRLRARHAGAAMAASVVLTGSLLSIDGAYSLLARPLDLRPITAVATNRPRVGLLVDVPARLVPGLAGDLARAHAHATFAVAGGASASTLAHASAAGDEVIPRLNGSRFASWVHARAQVLRSAHRLGLSGHFLYAVPPDGFTLGQYLLAHTAGGTPVSGAFRYTGAAGRPSALRAGDLVEVTLPPDAASATQTLTSIAEHIRHRGLQPVRISDLLHPRPQ